MRDYGLHALNVKGHRATLAYVLGWASYLRATRWSCAMGNIVTCELTDNTNEMVAQSNGRCTGIAGSRIGHGMVDVRGVQSEVGELWLTGTRAW